MSGFDVTLTAGPVQLAAPEEVEPGTPSMVEIHAPVIIPIPTQQGVMPLPIGMVRIPVERDHAIQFGKKMVEVAEKLPPTSKLEVASNLEQVMQAGEQMQRMRGEDGK